MASVVELAEFARAVYTVNDRYQGWQRGRDFGNDRSGYYAALFTKESEMVFAIRGTDSQADDFVNDVMIFLGMMPPQAFRANQDIGALYDCWRQSGGFYLTGHSLGGGLASVVGARRGIPTVTFNAPGMMRSCVNQLWLGGSTPLSCFAYEFGSSRMLNIRLNLDPVSVGTGQDMGPTTSLPSTCGTTDLFCWHSMDMVVAAVRGEPAFHEDLGW